MRILGISAFYHDAAACLVEDGEIIAAAEEERFTRRKHDADFPRNAVRYCLAEGDVPPGGVDAVAFYDKPILKFHRLLETYFSVAPRGLRSFLTAVPLWLQDKLWVDPKIREELLSLGAGEAGRLHFMEHHLSHAASAFFPSPFEEAAVLTLDGVGEWATASIAVGEGHRLRLDQELRFPHSLGLLYSAFTGFCGFKVNSGEYKLMGLAPYGQGRYTRLILERLVDLKEDGSFRLDLSYFSFLDGLRMTNAKFAALFGGPPREPESRITQRECDLARSIQEVTEEIVLRMARHARARTGMRRLCLAGGVALNCVANGRLLREGVFEELWIQPAAGDAGGAVGAALALWHEVLGNERSPDGRQDGMQGALLGPEFHPEQIREWLVHRGLPFREPAPESRAMAIADLVAQEKVVGLFQGRMEFGPRALGNRSIIGDPRSPRTQAVMNLKIKQRESFRPFAPAVLAERASDYFELEHPSPYMLLVAPVQPSRRVDAQPGERSDDLLARVNQVRSDIPAVTHVDHSARVQTVDPHTNPSFHDILQAFEERTGCPMVVNTSFNLRGEPIVCTPEDAYRCFMRSEMDCLVLGPFLLDKAAQPPFDDDAAPLPALD